MPYAFGHLVGAWGLAKLYERLRRYSLSHLEWGLLLFGALVPDADLLLDWTVGSAHHRGLTHSLLFALLAGLIVWGLAGALKSRYKSFRPKAYGVAIACGVMTHLFLDMALGSPGIRLLWPLEASLWLFGSLPSAPPSYEFSGQAAGSLKFAIVDMGLGAAWIGYLWLRKWIRF